MAARRQIWSLQGGGPMGHARKMALSGAEEGQQPTAAPAVQSLQLRAAQASKPTSAAGRTCGATCASSWQAEAARAIESHCRQTAGAHHAAPCRAGAGAGPGSVASGSNVARTAPRTVPSQRPHSAMPSARRWQHSFMARTSRPARCMHAGQPLAVGMLCLNLKPQHSHAEACRTARTTAPSITSPRSTMVSMEKSSRARCLPAAPARDPGACCATTRSTGSMDLTHQAETSIHDTPLSSPLAMMQSVLACRISAMHPTGRVSSACSCRVLARSSRDVLHTTATRWARGGGAARAYSTSRFSLRLSSLSGRVSPGNSTSPAAGGMVSSAVGAPTSRPPPQAQTWDGQQRQQQALPRLQQCSRAVHVSNICRATVGARGEGRRRTRRRRHSWRPPAPHLQGNCAGGLHALPTPLCPP